MKKRREVLSGFSWKKTYYYKGGSIIEDNFTELEIKVLENLGKIPKEIKKKPVSKKKKPDAVDTDKD